MCFYNTRQKEIVATALNHLLSAENPFTGWNVHKFMVDNYMTTTEDLWQATETSAYVRELFNTGEMPGWASTQVVPKTGPVLYFKMTPSMKATKVAAEIRSRLPT